MHDRIVMTNNLLNFVGLVEALTNKPERVDRMGLVFGPWGLGKTTSMEWVYANRRCAYSRAWAPWSRSPSMMCEDLLRSFRVEAAGTLKKDLRELIQVAKKFRMPLFIDEADRVVRKTLLIEIVRDIHDAARIPVILIGQENIHNMLQRKDLGQVYSRISEIMEFRPLDVESIQTISQDLCGLKCSPEVGAFIQEATLGDFRLLNGLLVRAEKMCVYNGAQDLTMRIAREAAKKDQGGEEPGRIARFRAASSKDETRTEAAAG